MSREEVDYLQPIVGSDDLLQARVVIDWPEADRLNTWLVPSRKMLQLIYKSVDVSHARVDVLHRLTPHIRTIGSVSQHLFRLLLWASLTSAVSIHHIEYSTVTGYFLQDLSTTNATSFG
jgi:hypothetical protein